MHELAYLEVGRAPYTLIKRASATVPMETMRAMLDNLRYAEWHSLAILMLGQSDDAADRVRAYKSLNANHRFGLTTNLSAWTAAVIEMDGLEGLRYVEQHYVHDQGRSREELEFKSCSRFRYTEPPTLLCANRSWRATVP